MKIIRLILLALLLASPGFARRKRRSSQFVTGGRCRRISVMEMCGFEKVDEAATYRFRGRERAVHLRQIPIPASRLVR
jgi:hypothetical protein